MLGPFQGRPACVRIALGQGVCGTAAAERRSIVVPDVDAFPGHIACDTASRSELVVPLLAGDALLGVLDLDSPVLGRFDDAGPGGLRVAGRVMLRHGSAALAQPSLRSRDAGEGREGASIELHRYRHSYRLPKIALPTRTQVAPQAIAISKSADIPIDTTPSPCRAARSASHSKCGRGS